MKVVLFCGGLGLRMRDASITVPKPLVTVGDRPILWHVMRYYAHYGHKDFVLCIGHNSAAFEEYFRSAPDIDDWRITLADTGVASSIGERLALVRPYVAGESIFLANYADGLTDLHLPDLIDTFVASDKVGALICVRPALSYHFIRTDTDGTVIELAEPTRVDLRVNGGYFVFRQAIFDVMRGGEDLVEGPLQRLIARGALLGRNHDGFWKNMDTFKDKQALDELHA